MASETLVATFENAGDAKAAIADLEKAGVPSRSIAKRIEEYSQEDQQPSTQPSVTSRGGFWSWLGSDQGSDQHNAHSDFNDRLIASGPIVVAVEGNDAQLEKALSIFENHTPADIEQRFSAPIVAER